MNKTEDINSNELQSYNIESSDDEMDVEPSDFGYRSELDFSTWIKARDKFWFVLGTGNVVATAYFMGGYQYFMPIYYTFKFPLLIGSRIISYSWKKYTLFLVDFCYFSNILLLIYLWFMRDNPFFFQVIWGICHGPLLWAVILFRNSLVYHSGDKITSLFIHITPPMVLSAIRWFPGAPWLAGTNEEFAFCIDTDCQPQWMYTMFIPSIIAFCHQLLYLFLVQFLHPQIRGRDKHRKFLSTYKYLTGDKKGMMFKIVNCRGPKLRPIFFGLIYFLYASLATIPSYFMYKYYWLEFSCLVLGLTVATWNGANFYIEVFAKNYIKEIGTTKRAKPTHIIN